MQVAVADVITCAGHYYVEATGGRYVAQGERHAFETRIASQRAMNVTYRDAMGADEAGEETVDLATLADLTDPVTGE